MASAVRPIAEGFHTVTPTIIVKGGAKAIEFYKKAFGAEEVMSIPGPNGMVMHAEIRIGDSIIMLSDEWPEYGAKAPAPDHWSSSLHLYVSDVDKAFQRAVDAGCSVRMPVADMFWGDRYGKVVDPFGHQWGLATHKEDVSPEECAKRAAAWGKGGGCAQS